MNARAAYEGGRSFIESSSAIPVRGAADSRSEAGTRKRRGRACSKCDSNAAAPGGRRRPPATSSTFARSRSATDGSQPFNSHYLRSGERFGPSRDQDESHTRLVSQIRRAAVSIPANIAEGSKRRRNNDYARFLNIAEGSAAEVDYFLILSRDLGLVTAKAAEPIRAELDEIARMLNGLPGKVERSA